MLFFIEQNGHLVRRIKLLVNIDFFMEGFILSLSMSLKDGRAKEEELIAKLTARGISKKYAVSIVEEAKKRCKQ